MTTYVALAISAKETRILYAGPDFLEAEAADAFYTWPDPDDQRLLIQTWVGGVMLEEESIYPQQPETDDRFYPPRKHIHPGEDIQHLGQFTTRAPGMVEPVHFFKCSRHGQVTGYISGPYTLRPIGPYVRHAVGGCDWETFFAYYRVAPPQS